MARLQAEDGTMFPALRTGAVIGAALTVVSATIALVVGPAGATGPTISSFSPPAANVGTTITIDGSGLADATEVAFNFNAAQITSDTDTELTALVPLANDDGPITVTTAGGTATSSTNFTLIGFYVTTTSLPGAQAGEEYSLSLEAAGGTPPYHWSVATGPLPTGLRLSRQGVLGGLLTSKKDKPGTYDFVVQVRDSTRHQKQLASRSLALTLS